MALMVNSPTSDAPSLHFHGPFTFVDHGRGIATCEFAKSRGVYLWVLSDGNSRYIHYIGQTPNFLSRHKDHLFRIIGFHYGLFRADAVASRDSNWLFEGMWRLPRTQPKGDHLTITVNNWRELHQNILPYLESIEVFFAPTPALSNNERCHLEGCIAHHLRNKQREHADFYPDDNRANIVGPMLNKAASVTSDHPIMGLGPLLEL
jgi:hypothetical protein